MEFFKLAATAKDISENRILQSNSAKVIQKYKLKPEEAKHYYHVDNNKGLRQSINEDMKK